MQEKNISKIISLHVSMHFYFVLISWIFIVNYTLLLIIFSLIVRIVQKMRALSSNLVEFLLRDML